MTERPTYTITNVYYCNVIYVESFAIEVSDVLQNSPENW